MKKHIAFAIGIIMLLALGACKQQYPCDSRERRSACADVLGENYDMARYDEMNVTCDMSRGRTRERVIRCVMAYYPEQSYENVGTCYNADFMQFIACLENED